ncbi:hypothetical protein QFZ63_003951 [Streptomyces sp. B3I7]|nr:hypothetical protein [Streptomyces sp. B3I7]
MGDRLRLPAPPRSDRRGRGIGGRLVDLAERLRPSGLTLWTFQVRVQGP